MDYSHIATAVINHGTQLSGNGDRYNDFKSRLPLLFSFFFFCYEKTSKVYISMEFSYRKCKIHLSWLIEIVEEKTRGKITD
jgi:hypothetical protein